MRLTRTRLAAAATAALTAASVASGISGLRLVPELNRSHRFSEVSTVDLHVVHSARRLGVPIPDRGRAPCDISTMFWRFVLLLTLLAAALAATTTPASAAGGRSITPGVQMVTGGSVCTAGFVMRDRRGRLLVAYAARCASHAPTARSGCTARTRPMGTRVRFATGVTRTSAGRTLGWGTLRYSSWTAMRRAHVTSASQCTGNDLALVRVDRSARRRVSADLPFWGGGARTGAAPVAGAPVFTVARPGTDAAASPVSGTIDAPGELSTSVLGASDAGAPVLDGRGRAVGLVGGRCAGGVSVTDLSADLAFARRHGVRGLRLVGGHDRFHALAVA